MTAAVLRADPAAGREWTWARIYRFGGHRRSMSPRTLNDRTIPRSRTKRIRMASALTMSS